MMRGVLAVCVALAALTIVTACDEPPATEPVARGRQVYRKLDCGRCHVIDGHGGRIGPELEHVGAVAGTRRAGTAAEDYLRESVVSPGAYVVPGYNDVMPRGLARNLSDTDIDALVRYLNAHQ